MLFLESFPIIVCLIWKYFLSLHRVSQLTTSAQKRLARFLTLSKRLNTANIGIISEPAKLFRKYSKLVNKILEL